MSLVNVTNVEILDNPTPFTNPFQFEITFECLPPGVQEELEWKLVYVGSAEDEKYDQELDSVLVGPVVVGKNKFVFQAPAPNPALIPAKDVMEVTVLLLTAAYKEKEFIRIGYYVNNDYPSVRRHHETELLAERNAWLERVRSLQAEYAEAMQAVAEQEQALQQQAAAAAANAAGGQGTTAEAEVITLPRPAEPVMPPPPRVDISRLIRNILADKPRVTRFQVPWDQPQGMQEFAMDAADEAKATADAQAEQMATFADVGAAAGASGAGVADGEEDGSEDDDSDEEMADGGAEVDVDEDDDEEGEEEEDAEEEGVPENEQEDEEQQEEHKSGPQGMSVE